MPARLRFEFSSASIDTARLVLMHADTGYFACRFTCAGSLYRKRPVRHQISLEKQVAFMSLHTE